MLRIHRPCSPEFSAAARSRSRRRRFRGFRRGPAQRAVPGHPALRRLQPGDLTTAERGTNPTMPRGAGSVGWAEQALRGCPAAAGALEGIAVDGQTLRGSRRQGASDAHLLSTFSHRLGMVLGHCPEGTRVADKTNEIGAASAFLLTLVLEGRVVTADALLTRREIARTILDGGGDYLLVVKANQPTLHAASATAFAPAAGDFGLVGSVCTVSQHGDRIEYRRLSASIALLGYRGTRVRVVAGAAPGPADRTTRHPQGDRAAAAPRDRLRGDLARPRCGHPRATARPLARALGQREPTALHPRCHPRRGSRHRPSEPRPPGHGRLPQCRHRADPRPRHHPGRRHLPPVHGLATRRLPRPRYPTLNRPWLGKNRRLTGVVLRRILPGRCGDAA